MKEKEHHIKASHHWDSSHNHSFIQPSLFYIYIQGGKAKMRDQKMNPTLQIRWNLMKQRVFSSRRQDFISNWVNYSENHSTVHIEQFQVVTSETFHRELQQLLNTAPVKSTDVQVV